MQVAETIEMTPQFICVQGQADIKIGRPSAMTPEVISKLEYAFSLGSTDKEACLFSGILMDTLYKYQRKHPEFTYRKEELKENPVLLARHSVVTHIPEDATLALKYLERKKRDEFSIKTDIIVNVYAHLSETQIDDRIKRLEDEYELLIGDGVINIDQDDRQEGDDV